MEIPVNVVSVQMVLKLYDYPGAPNPRRVKIFLREKQLPFESVVVDLAKSEQREPEFLARNPSGKIPVLELEDGRCLGESVAICRYLEAIAPEPNLFGRDPFELGYIEMRNQQIEFELWMTVGTSWVNGPIVARMGRIRSNEQAKEASDAAVLRYYTRLDSELAEKPYIAGDRFTVADISALTAVDFASAMCQLRPDDGLQHLWQWHTRVSERDSVSD